MLSSKESFKTTRYTCKSKRTQTKGNREPKVKPRSPPKEGKAWQNQALSVVVEGVCTHPAAQGIPDPRSNSLALHLIHCLHHSHLHSHLDYLSHRSSGASFQCRKRFRVHCRHEFRLDDGRFCVFGEHSILEFVLQRVALQTKLVATAIFPTI